MNQIQAKDAIRARVDFKASALRGETVRRGFRSFACGRASRDTTDAMQAAWLADSLDYVVYSYATPIAWHDAEGWHVPADKYSVTTSKHQTITRRAVTS